MIARPSRATARVGICCVLAVIERNEVARWPRGSREVPRTIRKLGFIEYNGGLQINDALLGVVLHD